MIKFDKGVAGGVWLVFNNWPEDNGLDRYEHEYLAKGVGGELNVVYRKVHLWLRLRITSLSLVMMLSLMFMRLRRALTSLLVCRTRHC